MFAVVDNWIGITACLEELEHFLCFLREVSLVATKTSQSKELRVRDGVLAVVPKGFVPLFSKVFLPISMRLNFLILAKNTLAKSNAPKTLFLGESCESLFELCAKNGTTLINALLNVGPNSTKIVRLSQYNLLVTRFNSSTPSSFNTYSRLKHKNSPI